MTATTPTAIGRPATKRHIRKACSRHEAPSVSQAHSARRGRAPRAGSRRAGMPVSRSPLARARSTRAAKRVAYDSPISTGMPSSVIASPTPSAQPATSSANQAGPSTSALTTWESRR